jgi:hypothetical protein
MGHEGNGGVMRGGIDTHRVGATFLRQPHDDLNALGVYRWRSAYSPRARIEKIALSSRRPRPLTPGHRVTAHKSVSNA